MLIYFYRRNSPNSEKLGTSVLDSIDLMGTGAGALSLVLTAKIIDSSLGNARQATALMSVNKIQSMKLIDYPPRKLTICESISYC